MANYQRTVKCKVDNCTEKSSFGYKNKAEFDKNVNQEYTCAHHRNIVLGPDDEKESEEIWTLKWRFNGREWYLSWRNESGYWHYSDDLEVAGFSMRASDYSEGSQVKVVTNAYSSTSFSPSPMPEWKGVSTVGVNELTSYPLEDGQRIRIGHEHTIEVSMLIDGRMLYREAREVDIAFLKLRHFNIGRRVTVQSSITPYRWGNNTAERNTFTLNATVIKEMPLGFYSLITTNGAYVVAFCDQITPEDA